MQRESVVVSLPVSAGSETGCSEIDPPQAYVRGGYNPQGVGVNSTLMGMSHVIPKWPLAVGWFEMRKVFGLLIFLKRVGICSTLEAELCGLYEGLLAVWSVGICQLLIESDNLKAVKLLNNHGGFIVVPNIVHSIVEVLNWSWSTKLFHIGRGDNCSVDWMSKQANFDDLLCHRYLVPPESVKFLLQQDVAD
ncbi:hypothetical protein V6N12_059069 [Hibiscus sabdariffa]|uniref:RNase H type-1 domain-containing protein n=1 Tax=Hibiscus sabdariffa TaxID=183260 RepID=A0ABR2ETZ7_9ROSI